jgi:hypothetical protein
MNVYETDFFTSQGHARRNPRVFAVSRLNQQSRRCTVFKYCAGRSSKRQCLCTNFLSYVWIVNPLPVKDLMRSWLSVYSVMGGSLL